jgi:hypothetical protein
VASSQRPQKARKQSKEQLNHEKSRNHIHNNPVGGSLLLAFASGASGQPGAGRVLSGIHDGRRVQRS